MGGSGQGGVESREGEKSEGHCSSREKEARHRREMNIL